jgi:hypothetical protein
MDPVLCNLRAVRMSWHFPRLGTVSSFVAVNICRFDHEKREHGPDTALAPGFTSLII